MERGSVALFSNTVLVLSIQKHIGQWWAIQDCHISAKRTLQNTK